MAEVDERVSQEWEWRGPFVASPGRRLRSGRIAGIGVYGYRARYSGASWEEAQARGPKWVLEGLLSCETLEDAKAIALALNIAYPERVA